MSVPSRETLVRDLRILEVTPKYDRLGRVIRHNRHRRSGRFASEKTEDSRNTGREHNSRRVLPTL